MSYSLLLEMTSKESDKIKCENCEKGIFVPANPESKINHMFYCNHCGIKVHIDPNVNIE